MAMTDALSMGMQVRQFYYDSGTNEPDEALVQDIITDQLIGLPQEVWDSVISKAVNRAAEEVQERVDFAKGLETRNGV